MDVLLAVERALRSKLSGAVAAEGFTLASC